MTSLLCGVDQSLRAVKIDGEMGFYLIILREEEEKKPQNFFVLDELSCANSLNRPLSIQSQD